MASNISRSDSVIIELENAVSFILNEILLNQASQAKIGLYLV